MKKSPIIFLSSCGLFASAAIAGAPQSGLSFKHMESNQPNNPMLYSYEDGYLQHTSADRLADATAAIRGAVPNGTDRAMAEATLKQAGAHCHVKGAAETCRYFDLETPPGGYLDAVNWYVTLRLDNDHVSDISVDRTWVRSEA